MAEQLKETVNNLRWNNYTSVAVFTLMSYDYLLLLEKEVKYVWKRQWSVMSSLYLVVRYLGLFLAVIGGCWGEFSLIVFQPWNLSSSCHGLIVFIYWGYSAYFCFAEGKLFIAELITHADLSSAVILIWRLYAISDRSKRLLYVILGVFFPIVALSIGTDIYLYSRPSAFSVYEVVTPTAKYCTLSFNMGPMPAIYTSIPIICYDIFLVVLASATLVKHLKERRDIKIRPNTYVLLIVRYHIIYFVLNVTNQVLLTILWANVPMPTKRLSELFNDTAPFILAPRLIISIWDTHAHDKCVHVSTTFADCVCWTLPPISDSEEQELSQIS
ncbi:hypothetical protein AZE42_09581 [Rhizopogon vesiculosus]|uniref:DUF6533 domain-containing protein n=1 Tax=Rhizopogon vesiculosus TaxID=180088 RepID=A0A1J8PYH8_9AGAM|nr:hypothetical protein AZE42_09581 [Rhizopogon vesiculosus]